MTKRVLLKQDQLQQKCHITEAELHVLPTVQKSVRVIANEEGEWRVETQNLTRASSLMHVI